MKVGSRRSSFVFLESQSTLVRTIWPTAATIQPTADQFGISPRPEAEGSPTVLDVAGEADSSLPEQTMGHVSTIARQSHDARTHITAVVSGGGCNTCR